MDIEGLCALNTHALCLAIKSPGQLLRSTATEPEVTRKATDRSTAEAPQKFSFIPPT